VLEFEATYSKMSAFGVASFLVSYLELVQTSEGCALGSSVNCNMKVSNFTPFFLIYCVWYVNLYLIGAYKNVCYSIHEFAVSH
jgi:hypothetical protein